MTRKKDKPTGDRQDEKQDHKGKALPQDPDPVDQKPGGTTVVATVVLCSTCGHPNQIPQATTAHGIRSKCEKCESTIRVSGGKLAKVRIDRNAIKRADQLALMPTSTDEGKHAKGKGAGEGGSEYTYLRVKLSLEQMQIVRVAMEVCRRVCNAEGKDWSGRTIELICADYLSGADKEAVAQVERELEGE